MRNRLSKWSRNTSKMVALLVACGLLYACKDEYLLDDEKPSWLNSSVYESLEQRGNFNTYLKLLGDKDVNPENVRPLKDVLSRTGSKTVFVADDDAWDAFFKRNAQLPEANPWHTATSYENLSVSQKKLLIHTSMLNNAIVMENLASSQGSGSSSPIRGEYMRRYTDVEGTDTVTFVAPADLPHSYNPTDKDFWWRFREENGGKGIYVVKDSSLSMMLHFTSEHMTKNTVNDDDFAKFMGRERVTSDVHIYDAKLLEKDGVCENGYVNVTEKPLCPLPNMAEVIRSNGRTKIFSHMLDRYCAPYYCSAITRAYKILHPEFEDSIFTWRYYSDNSFGHRKNLTQPDGNPYTGDEGGSNISLKFDPGWNGYYDELGVQQDMAAMFVPSDDAMWTYFESGGGLQLIETYGDPTKEYNGDYEKLYENIDQIPISTLTSLINVIMCRSFVGSVPSKMTKLRDDAQEQLFYAEDIEKIDTCLLACNGAVYIMDDIYGPADYTSVTSPAYISKTNLVMKWAIYNGSDANNDYMGLNYYAYLKAMQSEFTFFLPSDNALQYYYDPTSFKSTQKRLIQFSYKNQSFPIVTRCINYDPKTGEIGRAFTGAGASISQSETTNRLKDILESHTIVHDGTNPIHGEDSYFLTKNGSAVKVERDENGTVTNVKGGFQLENEKEGIVSEDPGVDVCKVTKPFDNLKNGQTYILDAPIIPTSRSVYSILTQEEGWSEVGEEQWNEDCPYAEFYKLCETNDEIVRACGLVDETNLSTSEQRSAQKKFDIFVAGDQYNKMYGLDYDVQFFNNYRYTLFVPTNDAIKEAIAAGLPTWEDIQADYESCAKDSVSDELINTEDSIRLQAKITYLVNFVRYHFADNSVFADKTELAENEMVTSSYDKDLGLFCKVHVDRIKQGGETILRVRDDNGGEMMNIIGEKNILARDVVCSDTPINQPMSTSSRRITLDASSSAVIHQIGGILNHTELVNGRHDGTWATTESAKKYLKRYAIKNISYHEQDY